MNYGIAIHGGAGTILRSSMTPEKEKLYTEALKKAMETGYAILEKGGAALDAVEAAVRSLEDCPLFNAGKGAVFNHKGGHEMDASIMWGKDLTAGAVSLIKHVKNPVSLARAVMEKSENVFLCGEGAEEFAKEMKVEFAGEEYFHDAFRFEQWKKAQEQEGVYLDHNIESDVRGRMSEENTKDGSGIGPGTSDIGLSIDKKFGTVGAVALDKDGNLAAATSTGGMTNKKFGRVGDSPIIGAGTYANNHTCAISCTGHGELFIRSVVAYDISALMEYKNLSLREACEEVVMKKLVKIGGEGGLIAIDKQGNIELPFNSEGMYRAMKSSSGVEKVEIYK